MILVGKSLSSTVHLLAELSVRKRQRFNIKKNPENSGGNKIRKQIVKFPWTFFWTDRQTDGQMAGQKDKQSGRVITIISYLKSYKPELFWGTTFRQRVDALKFAIHSLKYCNKKNSQHVAPKASEKQITVVSQTTKVGLASFSDRKSKIEILVHAISKS